MDKLLALIEENPRLSSREMAVSLGMAEKEVDEQIKLYERTGVIKGYRAIIDKEKANAETVTALIEIKVHPKFEHGFNEVAEQISTFEEVDNVYLMSGSYDLCCFVSDKSFQEVAMFVANRLSPLDSVVSTATHFILKRFKEQGVLLTEPQKDDRGNISF